LELNWILSAQSIGLLPNLTILTIAECFEQLLAIKLLAIIVDSAKLGDPARLAL